MTEGGLSINRRSLIVGAGFATAAPALVRAQSLIELPGDPLTARGLFAASKWASEEFSELPGCRVVFADGQSTRWQNYTCMSRPVAGNAKERNYVVAIEVSVTDDNGARFVTSVPVNGARTARAQAVNREKQLAALASCWRRSVLGDDEIPF